jgi:hypothetical protein
VKTRVATIFIIAIVVMTFGIYMGCSKEAADTETAAETDVEETKDAVETAAEEAEVDLAAFNNPKEGICPVCQMKVEKGYIEVASVTDKKYACCSAGCVTALTEDPDKYLKVAEEGHEGHNH